MAGRGNVTNKNTAQRLARSPRMPRRPRPSITPEGRENQLISAAHDLVENPILIVDNVFQRHRIHVMNQRIKQNLVTRNSEITSVITNHHLTSNHLPSWRRIKTLIEKSIKPERGYTNSSTKFEIFETLLKYLKLRKFRICSNLLHDTSARLSVQNIVA